MNIFDRLDELEPLAKTLNEERDCLRRVVADKILSRQISIRRVEAIAVLLGARNPDNRNRGWKDWITDN